jgi:SNF2 family DNA or RNA helicase
LEAEILTHVSNQQLLKTIKSGFSSNLLFSDYSFCSIIIEHIIITAVFFVHFKVLDIKTEIIKVSGLSELTSSITNIELTPFKEPKVHGKSYRKKEAHSNVKTQVQLPLFDEYTESYNNKSKDYTKTLNQPRKVEEIDIWNLIFPILQPPIEYDISENFDLFKKIYKYQQEGIEFLLKNEFASLADEMGTGKTIQAILALRILFRDRK